MTDPLKTQPKRVRSEQLAFRLTPEEKARWDAVCARSGISNAALLMRLIDGNRIIVLDLQAVLGELRRQGNNLNQAVRHMHQCSSGTERELLAALQENRECSRQLMQLLSKGTPPRKKEL
ncbi:hypothetical protein NE562_13130 [Butyricicoccus faecihominis]|uniref:plasmid mobilization protein n=1 Tax=Butyricicoccus faecihominis TaxID=1712515 RepID=UPI00247959DF|nr:hypothetical protein [Butyricicoccus faecihominis]MCQ5130609.1 hypothetical protein [Butyricicoccus faecihominis]